MPAADDEEERHLALLSKIPFSSVRLEHDLDFVYFGGRKSPDRGLMEVEFQTKGTKWKLFIGEFILPNSLGQKVI